MKKKFKDTKFARFFKKKGFRKIADLLLGGLIDPPLIAGKAIIGAVTGGVMGVDSAAKDKKGKPNLTRIAGLVIFVLFCLAYVFELIDQETFEVMFNRLKELQE